MIRVCMVNNSHELAYAKARDDYMSTREVIFGHLDLHWTEGPMNCACISILFHPLSCVCSPQSTMEII